MKKMLFVILHRYWFRYFSHPTLSMLVLGLIHLHNAKFSPNYVLKFSIKEMKVKYIHTSLEKIILQICCDLFFKVM
jgi:hypothetical protein